MLTIEGDLESSLYVVLLCALTKEENTYFYVHAYANMTRTLTEVDTHALAPKHTERNETSLRKSASSPKPEFRQPLLLPLASCHPS